MGFSFIVRDIAIGMIPLFHFFFKFIEKLAYGHSILSSEIQGSGSSFRFQNLFLEVSTIPAGIKQIQENLDIISFLNSNPSDIYMYKQSKCSCKCKCA